MPDMTVWPTDSPSDGSVSSEARWRRMARLWVPSGVDQTRGGLLVPTLVAGPAVQVAPGGVWIDGHFGDLATQQTLAVPASANGLVVTRFTPADNRLELLYRDGVSVPTQGDPSWELPIALLTAGALGDRRVFANGSTPAALNFAALKLNYPAPPDGFQCVTLDDGRTYTRRVAATSYNNATIAAPSNRWETRAYTYIASRTSDSGGIAAFTPADFGLDGFWNVNANIYWAAVAPPRGLVAPARVASATVAQVQVAYLPTSLPSNVAFWGSHADGYHLEAQGWRV